MSSPCPSLDNHLKYQGVNKRLSSEGQAWGGGGAPIRSPHISTGGGPTQPHDHHHCDHSVMLRIAAKPPPHVYRLQSNLTTPKCFAFFSCYPCPGQLWAGHGPAALGTHTSGPRAAGTSCPLLSSAPSESFHTLARDNNSSRFVCSAAVSSPSIRGGLLSGGTIILDFGKEVIHTELSDIP